MILKGRFKITVSEAADKHSLANLEVHPKKTNTKCRRDTPRKLELTMGEKQTCQGIKQDRLLEMRFVGHKEYVLSEFE